MSDFASINIVSQPFHDAMADIRRVSDRAAMWAVRESARQTGRAAKRHAPVYAGTRKTARVNVGTRKYVSGKTKEIEIVPGLYKKSIKSSRRMQRVLGGDGFRVAVGPRGGHVHLYAQKVERKYQPMAKGFAEVRPLIGAIHEKALARAVARFGK